METKLVRFLDMIEENIKPWHIWLISFILVGTFLYDSGYNSGYIKGYVNGAFNTVYEEENKIEKCKNEYQNNTLQINGSHNGKLVRIYIDCNSSYVWRIE